MKKLIYLVVSVFLFVSCQKEHSGDSNRTVNDTLPTGLLKKEVSVYLPDKLESLVYDYKYNSSRKLVSLHGIFRMTDPGGGILYAEGTNVFTRDEAGKVIHIDVEKGSKLSVEYYPGTERVKKMHNNTGLMYNEYLFGSDGNLDRVMHYQRYPTENDSFKLFAYYLYKFNTKGNLYERSVFIDNSGSENLQLQSTLIFEHDNKVNPHYLKDHSLYQEVSDAASPNNVTRIILVYNNGNNRDTTNYRFTYDSENRPLERMTNNDTETKYYYY